MNFVPLEHILAHMSRGYHFLVWGGRGLKFGACVRDVCPCQMVYCGQQFSQVGPGPWEKVGHTYQIHFFERISKQIPLKNLYLGNHRRYFCSAPGKYTERSRLPQGPYLDFNEHFMFACRKLAWVCVCLVANLHCNWCVSDDSTIFQKSTSIKLFNSNQPSEKEDVTYSADYQITLCGVGCCSLAAYCLIVHEQCCTMAWLQGDTGQYVELCINVYLGIIK
jgi:hypothetical protein